MKMKVGKEKGTKPMGYLTPILIHNDDLDQIIKNPQQLIDAIQKACNSFQPMDHGIGNCANVIESLPTEHADFDRVIVISGNTWMDVTRESYKEAETINEKLTLRPVWKSIYANAIKLLKATTKRLEQKL